MFWARLLLRTVYELSLTKKNSAFFLLLKLLSCLNLWYVNCLFYKWPMMRKIEKQKDDPLIFLENRNREKQLQ